MTRKNCKNVWLIVRRCSCYPSWCGYRSELKEKKHRIEDALNATRAAVEEGIVAGGGTTFIDIMTALDAITAVGDEKTGVAIVKRAVEEPVRQIANNAGLEGSVVVEQVKKAGKGIGFNALTEQYVDMIAAGIVDPAKVTRSASAKCSQHCSHGTDH